MSAQPIDLKARRRAIEDVKTSMTLSAGAGSGKTSVLTSRIISLLTGGVAPRAIAAITFTEKAAGELQARVRDGLESRLEAGADPILEAALAGLSGMTLSTIHSFCQSLLSAEALEAGWAPDSEVGATSSQSPELQAAWRRWRRGLDERVGPLSALLIRLLINDNTLRAATEGASSYRDLEPVMADTPFELMEALDDLRPLLDAVASTYALCLKPDECKLALKNAALVERLRGFQPGADLAWLLTLGKIGHRAGGKAKDWAAPGKKAFFDALDGVVAWQTRQMEGLHALLAADVRGHLFPAIAHAKLDSGAVGFDDLLFRAAALLDDPAARARLASRYEILLVDEVQDTDPIQARVAALLTRPAEEQDPSWIAAPPQPGRLFAVGDPNQSIYRFRRADVATWSALSDLVERGGVALRLEQNFRSVPGIVRWVNHAFADLPSYVPQTPWRPDAALEPVVLLPVEGKEALKSREREALLGHLWSLMRAKAEVTDRETNQLRPMRWDDVMVLLPAWSQAEDLQADFTRAGIPALVEGGNSFYDRDEIRLCFAALKALIEPEDTESVVFTLRGIFGLDYNLLAAHKAQGGGWREAVTSAEAPPEGPAAEALRALGELRRLQARRSLSWVEILEDLLTQTQALGVWSLLPDGPARMANLDKLFTHIRQLEAERLSPMDLLDGLSQLKEQGEADLSRVDVGLNTVRITSYFKAKGLEAPIVALIHADRRAGAISAVVDRVAEEVALKYGPLVPPGWDRRKKEEQEAQQQERRRWMYVACTRPRDQLVIVHPTTKPGLLKLLSRGLIEAPGGGVIKLADDVTVCVKDSGAELDIPWQEEAFPGLDEQVRARLADPSATPPSWVERGPDLGGEAVAEAKGASVRWRSVQDMAHRATVEGEGEGLGREAGTLLHEVMERLDLTTPQAALEAQASALLNARALLWSLDVETVSRLQRILRQILRHEVIERARRAPERWTEAAFTYESRGYMISGAIDLCFPEDEARERWVVVDWKSTLPAKGSPGWGNYQRQLRYYEAALKSVLGDHISVEVVLVGPPPPVQVELSF